MSTIVFRHPGDNPGPDIVDPLLTTDLARRERGRAEINYHDSDRIILKGNGPKNDLMEPTRLVEATFRDEKVKGILTLYSRSYNLQNKNKFSITSSFEIETIA